MKGTPSFQHRIISQYAVYEHNVQAIAGDNTVKCYYLYHVMCASVWLDQHVIDTAAAQPHTCVKVKGRQFGHKVIQLFSIDRCLDRYLQPLPALMLMVIAIVIHFYDRVDFGVKSSEKCGVTSCRSAFYHNMATLLHKIHHFVLIYSNIIRWQ